MAAREASLDQQWREHVDRVLLDPARLFVMAALVSPDFYRLGYLSECSGVARTVLVRHVRKLRYAGYVESRRGAYQQLPMVRESGAIMIKDGGQNRDAAPAVIWQWTGREANALRCAVRMSVRDFAEHLGVSARAVSRWGKLGADTVPRPYMQAILDTAFARADEAAQRRFEALLAQSGN